MAIITIPDLDLTGDTDTGTITRANADVDEWAALVRWVGDRRDWSARELGQRVGVGARAVRSWRAGDDTPSPPVRRLLLVLAREILLADE